MDSRSVVTKGEKNKPTEPNHKNKPIKELGLKFLGTFKVKYFIEKSMYAAVEHGPVLCSDSNILCLSWKGRVPKSEKEKPVCRRRYYEEGWLATGNGRGVVGVTFTSSHCRRDRSTPQRINFNLRGHNSEVSSTLFAFSVVISSVLLEPPSWPQSLLQFLRLRGSETWYCKFCLLCAAKKDIKVSTVHSALSFHK